MAPSVASPLSSPLSPDELFALVRSTLIDVMGSTSFAVLLRRAISRAVTESPELAEIAVLREGMAYIYRLPESWRLADNAAGYDALGELLRAMLPLIEEITGRLGVRRVIALPALHDYGVIGPKEIALWRASA